MLKLGIYYAIAGLVFLAVGMAWRDDTGFLSGVIMLLCAALTFAVRAAVSMISPEALRHSGPTPANDA